MYNLFDKTALPQPKKRLFEKTVSFFFNKKLFLTSRQEDKRRKEKRTKFLLSKMSSTSTLTPDLRDLVFNQPYISVSPEDTCSLPSETLLRAISSSSLFPVHHVNHLDNNANNLNNLNNVPVVLKKQRKFALNLRQWTPPNQVQQHNQSDSLPSRVETQSRAETESAVVLLIPDLSGKCFVSRRIDLVEGSDVQVSFFKPLVIQKGFTND